MFNNCLSEVKVRHYFVMFANFHDAKSKFKGNNHSNYPEEKVQNFWGKSVDSLNTIIKSQI